MKVRPIYVIESASGELLTSRGDEFIHTSAIKNLQKLKVIFNSQKLKRVEKKIESLKSDIKWCEENDVYVNPEYKELVNSCHVSVSILSIIPVEKLGD